MSTYSNEPETTEFEKPEDIKQIIQDAEPTQSVILEEDILKKTSLHKEFTEKESKIEQETIEQVTNINVNIESETKIVSEINEDLKFSVLNTLQQSCATRLEGKVLTRPSDEVTGEAYLTNVQKSIDIFHSGISQIDSSLEELSKQGFQNNDMYQHLITEKRKFYSKIAKAHQKLKNFDEALKYNNLVLYYFI
jgi:hypothetical protein